MSKTKLTVTNQKEKSKKEAKPLFSDGGVKWLHIILISFVFIGLYNWIYNSEFIDLNGDNFAYYLLGKLLAEGKGFINATSVTVSAHTHFPPGFPVIIAFCIKLFNADMNDIALVVGSMYWLALIFFYLAMNKIQGSKSLSFVVVFFVLLNSLLFSSAVTCMSEIPFLFVCILGIFFMSRADEKSDNLFNPNIFLAALLFALAYYIKSIGIALFGALFLYLLFSKKWKQLAVSSATYVLLVLPWIIRGKMVGSSYARQLMQVNPYKPELGDLTTTTFIERIQNNFTRYISLDIPNSIFNMQRDTEQTPFSFWVVGLLIITAMFFGIFRLKDYRLFFLSYIIAVFSILLIWPDAFGGLRFIEVLVPVFLFLMIFGVVELLNFTFGKIKISFSPYWLLIFVFYYVTPLENLKAQLSQAVPQNYRNYFELAKWAKQNTPKDAVFSARKADIFMYYSDRVTVGDKPSLNDTVVLDFFRTNGVDYVVLEQLGFASTPKYLYPAIQKNQDKFVIASQLPNPDTYLLKFTEGDR
jgi:hypothetical protein